MILVSVTTALSEGTSGRGEGSAADHGPQVGDDDARPVRAAV